MHRQEDLCWLFSEYFFAIRVPSPPALRLDRRDSPAIMNAMMFLQRHELRRLGFYFAREETYTPGVLQLPAWCQPLVVHAMDASSTDAHDQGPQNLLQDDNQFWSSTASDSQDSNEWLQLRSEGLCCVQAVQIQGFRANFQPG